MVEQRQVAADAIALARIILGRFTDVGSIGAIANVRRSTWVDAGQVLAWRENLDRLAGELTPRVEFCNWCPTPTAPEPAFHPNGGAAHQETLRPETVEANAPRTEGEAAKIDLTQVMPFTNVQPVFGPPCTDPLCEYETCSLQPGRGMGISS